MQKIINLFSILFFLMLWNGTTAFAKKTIEFSPQEGDMTMTVRKALEETEDKDLILVFAKGKYFFRPDYAFGQYCHITNHDNGYKKISFLLEGLNSIEIQGNDSEFIFHGRVLPFQFVDCNQITVSGLTIDWDIPFTFQGEIVGVNEKEEWIDIKPDEEGFSYNFKKGLFTFPNIDGFTYSKLGSSLHFDAVHKRVSHGAYDHNSSLSRVEKLKDGVFRIHESRKHFPPVGAILNFKGPKGENRYAPAIRVVNSKDIHFDQVIIHHALGMGFLFERSENATLTACGVHLRDGTSRVISSTADATHFCNCKGDILVENCRFENMLDDGTNVHGTYVNVDEVLDENTVRVELAHFQQLGFEFAGVGDEVWFIHQPSPQRATVNKVIHVKNINDRFIEIQFENKLPADLAKGDLLENKTWNPKFTMRGCTIRDHRARNIVIKTPEKIVIEDNDLSSMMSSIFFRGESYYWFESGAVADVLIQNNRFEYCAYSGSEHAVMWITPRLGKTFDSKITFDKNIRFINNEIKTFDNRIIRADRVDGLTISGNKITQTKSASSLYPNAHLFDFINCKNVLINNNTYTGTHKKWIKADDYSKPNIKVKGNTGFSNDLPVRSTSLKK